MRIPILFTAFLGSMFARSQDKLVPYPSVTAAFPLLWRAETGAGSFRTNVVLNGSNLIMGSNGSQFMDYYLLDEGAGVYVLDRINGKKLHHIASENIGDMDVNGVLQYNGKLYFGNDNEEFICSTPDGQILWRNPASGDIEHEPVLLNIKGRPAIVYATESGEVKAVDAQMGKMIWSYYTPDFTGWKPGDNRTIFKVKAYFSNSHSFFTKPYLFDLDIDGVMDLLYITYDNKVYSISGATGKCLWMKDWENSLGYAINVHRSVSGPVILLLSSKWDSNESQSRYTLSFLDRSGNIKKQIPVPGSWGEGLNMLDIGRQTSAVLLHDALLLVHTDGSVDHIDRRDVYEAKRYDGTTYLENRHTSSSLLSNRVFQFGEYGRCVLVRNQYDRIADDRGTIEIISLDKKKVVHRYTLPCGGEMIPFIEDVNRDGYLDLLINGYDGYTYCFNMKIPFESRYTALTKK